MSAKHVDVSCCLSQVSVTVKMSAVWETNELASKAVLFRVDRMLVLAI